MSTEELKMIIEALQGATGEAKTVILMWLAKDVVGNLIALSGLLGAFWLGCRTVLRCVSVTSFAEKARSHILPDEIGNVGSYDLGKMDKWIREHAAKDDR